MRFIKNEYNPYSHHFIKREDEAYIASGKWKCPNSPTGAHVWNVTFGENHTKVCYCPHCKTEKIV